MNTATIPNKIEPLRIEQLRNYPEMATNPNNYDNSGRVNENLPTKWQQNPTN